MTGAWHQVPGIPAHLWLPGATRSCRAGPASSKTSGMQQVRPHLCWSTVLLNCKLGNTTCPGMLQHEALPTSVLCSACAGSRPFASLPAGSLTV